MSRKRHIFAIGFPMLVVLVGFERAVRFVIAHRETRKERPVYEAAA